MKNKMNRRLLKLFLLANMVVILTGSGLAGSLLPLLAPHRAYAAGDPQYALYFPDDESTKSDLRAAAQDGDIRSADKGGVLNKTSIISKGGPLGTFILNFHARNSVEENVPTYSRDYYCYPTDNYRVTTDAPDASKPYIRYTYGVAILNILHSKDWKGIADDPNYFTRVGMLGNDNVGTAHFPTVRPVGGATIGGIDYDLKGVGSPKYNIRDSAKAPFGTFDPIHSFNNPSYGGNNKGGDLDKAALDKCRMSPRGALGNKVINLSKASAATKAEWDKARKDAGGGGAPPGGTGVKDQGGSQELECESHNPLGWIECVVLDQMVTMMGKVDDLIVKQLAVGTNNGSDQPTNIFADNKDKCTADNNACANYKQAWASFRNIALGLMVIAGLVIVTSQALGLELLDAYTIRKALPRLLIAAIGITLSWPLMQFAVTLSNDLGFGIKDLIEAPFPKAALHVNFGDSFLAAAGAGLGLYTMGPLGVFFLALSGILAVFIAILVLILRQVLIIMLLILAPVAIVAYILPNTQRVFKLWWESFSKALLMFPLIIALIASGHVFSSIASSRSNDFIDQIIAFVAYFAPYFLIAATFKLAGGALSALGGAINNRSSGLFGALGNARKANTKDRVQRARTGGIHGAGLIPFNYRLPGDKKNGRPKRRGSIGKMLNTFGAYTLNADEQWLAKAGTTTLGGLKKKPGLPLLRAPGRAKLGEIQQKRMKQNADAAQEVNPGYKAGRLMGGAFGWYDEDLTTADQEKLQSDFGLFHPRTGSFMGYRQPDNFGEREDVADIFDRSTNLEGREAAKELRAKNGQLEAYSSKAETHRVDGGLVGLTAAARDGRLDIDDVVNNHNSLLAIGKSEQATRETTTLQDLLAQRRPSAARGHGIGYDKNGYAFNVYKERDKDDPLGAVDPLVEAGPFSEKARSSLARFGTQDLGQMKSQDLEGEMGEAWVAQASDHEMELAIDPNNDKQKVKKVMFKMDSNGQKIAKTGLDAERAKQMQATLKTASRHSSGDHDVRRNIASIADRIGLPRSELTFDRASGTEQEAAAYDAAHQYQREAEHNSEGQGQDMPF